MTYLTDTEARTQPCIGPVGCGSEPRGDTVTTYPRPGSGLPPTHDLRPAFRRCIGSACRIAWRWGIEEIKPSGPAHLAAATTKRPSDRGYCGLAGKPEGEPA